MKNRNKKLYVNMGLKSKFKLLQPKEDSWCLMLCSSGLIYQSGWMHPQLKLFVLIHSKEQMETLVE
jgi:hypothetical protein